MARLFLFLVVVMLFPGCYVYNQVHTSNDANADFSAYRTFAWLPDQTDTSELPYKNEVIRNNIRNYFGQEFSRRGFTVDLDTPDILLNLVIKNEKKKLLVYTHHPRPYYYRKYYYGSVWYVPYTFEYYYRNPKSYCYPPECTINKVEYWKSSITLHVLDRRSNKLVWTATAQGDIYDPANLNRSIHPAVVAIMKRFPVTSVPRPGDRVMHEGV